MKSPSKFAEFVELLKLEHSLFALPFAFMGAFLAAEGFPDLRTTLLIIACMVSARTAGMSFNRVLDASIDAKNPRTATRAVPAGRVSKASVWFLALLSLALLSAFAWLLNPLAFYLSPLCHLMLIGYSLTKRFTWGCHFFLGLVEAFAPIGGWIAVKGTCTDWTPYLLGLGTVFWIAGLDIVYATQDSSFDRKNGLFSIPARFGEKKSFMLARLSHLLTVALIIGVGLVSHLSLVFWIGTAIVTSLFIYQHSLVGVGKKEQLQFAFFNLNSWIAFSLMMTTLIETRAWKSFF